MKKTKRMLSLALSAAMLLTAIFPGPSALAARPRAEALSIPDDAETVQSQDGSVQAGFWLNEKGTPMYAVTYKDKMVVEPSAMGMQLTFPDEESIGEADVYDSNAPLSGTYDDGFTLLGTDLQEDVDESWTNNFGELKEVPNIYSELTLQYEAENGFEIDVVCRVSNEGAAFRYEFPQSDTAPAFQIDQELTYFNLDNRATAYAHVNRNQSEVKKIPVAELEAVKSGYFRPLTVVGDGYAMTITEAEQVDYTRVHFTQDGEAGTLRTMFNGTSDNSDLLPEHRVDPVAVDVSGDRFATSWRTFVLGDNEGQLLERNYLVKNLNPECALDDTSWIEPGMVLRSGLSEESAKANIDFAVDHNISYVHFDAGWYGPEGNMNSDPWECIKFDFPTIRDYAEERGIKLMVYVNYRHLEDQYNKGQLDALFKHYVEDWGISGIKFGFVPVGSQASTKMVYEWVKLAAGNHLVVDIHDEMLPTGYDRTYPNLLTMEGIHGDEENPLAEEDLGYLFTRSIAGQADHTWCYGQTKNTTKAFKFAGSIAFFSPLVFPYWYDDASKVDTTPLGLWDNLPTVWDETKVLEASVEKYATIARRAGEKWFLASFSADDGKALELPLDFLSTDTTYKAEFFTNDAADSRKVALFTYLVKADTVLKNRTPYNTGYSVMMTPTTEEEAASLPVYSTSFDAAEAVIDRIDTIGDITVDNAEEKAPLLKEIRTAYDALNTEQKLYVTNYVAFEAKESSLETLYNHPMRSLIINGEEYKEFDPNTLSYNMVLQGGMDVPEIGGILEDGSKITAVSQVKSLPGDATITVANRFTEKTYTVNFTIPNEELSVYAGDMPTPALDGRKEYKIDTNRGGGALTLYNAAGEKKTFKKGIGTHANTDITYTIEGMGITRFQAFCGVSTENGKEDNKVKCQVYVDNNLVFDSDVMTQKTPYKTIDIDVTGAKTVKLVANDGGDSISNDHVNWCEAKFIIGEIFTAPIAHMIEKAEACLATLTDEAKKAELQQAIDAAALVQALPQEELTYEKVYTAAIALRDVLDAVQGDEPGDITSFTPGQVWNDTDGVPIQAHGGGVIWDENTQKYYWYGEHKGEENIAGGRVSAIGVSVYSSTDLYNWKNEGIALPVFNNPAFTDADAAISDDTPLYLAESSQAYQDAVSAGGTASPYKTLEKYNKASYIEKLNVLYDGTTAADKKALYNTLNWDKVLERPKVIYNEKTKQYVMWFHRDGPNATTNAYSDSQAGVAVSDSPAGPFKYLGSSRPNGAMSRDMTLFKDDDGTAYLIHSSENNWTLYIQKLDETYTKVTGEYTRNYTKHENVEVDGREAPAMFKHDGRYYIVSSGCTGWRANVAGYSSTDLDLMTTMTDPYDVNALAGPFTNADLKNPCTGSGAAQTFQGQSTCVFPVQGKENMFIFMADKWNGNNLRDSRYLWLPVQVDDEADELTISWADEWTLGDFEKLQQSDRSALNRAVKQAADMTEVDYGADTESWQKMQTLLQQAYDLPYSASAEETADLAEQLQVVIDRLELRGDLNAALAEAAKLFEANYTTESWAALTETLKQADALPGDATKEAIDAVTAAIRDAIANLVPAEAVETAKMTITQAAADSAQSGNEAAKAIDGNTSTHWHTRWGTGATPLPHEITVDLGAVQDNLCELRYLPRQDKDWNGTILKFELYASDSDQSIDALTDDDFTKVLTGQWDSTKDEKSAPFRSISARYLKLVALTSKGNSEKENNQFASASEINVYAAQDTEPKNLAVSYSGKDVKLSVNDEAQPLADLIGKYQQKSVESGSAFTFTFTPRTENKTFRSVSVNGAEAERITGTSYSYSYTMGNADANLTFAFELVDQTTLQAMIGYAKKAIDDGEVEALVPAVQKKFMDAYDAAVAVNENDAATQEEIDTAWSDLLNAMHYLEFKPGDKAKLNDLIAVAETLTASDFTEESWNKLASSLEEAKGTAADENAVQNDIDTAYTNLNQALSGLVRTADRTALQMLVEKAGTIDLDDYLDTGKEAFTAALTQANQVLKKTDAVQTEIDAAAQALSSAMADLRKIPSKAELEALIAQMEQMNLDGYTESSTANFRAALQVLKAAQNADGKTRAAAYSGAQASITALEKETSVAPSKPDNGGKGNGSSSSNKSNSYGAQGSAAASPMLTAAQSVSGQKTYVVSDTTKDFILTKGSVYCFKMTVVNGQEKPNFTVGNGSVIKTQFVAQIGNEYDYRVYAVGVPGQSTGVYTALPGQQPQKHCAVAIG